MRYPREAALSRRFLITGGAGFIGSHVVDCLVGRGDEVHVLDDFSRGRPEWVPDAAHVHRADIRDSRAVHDVVAETAPLAVMHLAALHFIPAVDRAPELAWAVNVDGTRNLVEALRSRPPRVLVFASSAAVYPDRRGPIPESCPVAPLDLYGRTKVAAEELVEQLSDDAGTRCIRARLFNVIGDRETNPHVVPEIVAQVRKGADRLRLGTLETRRDYTNVTDVASALVRLLDATSAAGVVNVGTGTATSVADLVALCARIVGRELEAVLDESRVRRVDRGELVADTTLLSRTTQWAPETVEETLRALLLSE